MTLLVNLDGRAGPPTRPPFVTPVNDPATFILRVVRSIVKARRIAVVCGAWCITISSKCVIDN